LSHAPSPFLLYFIFKVVFLIFAQG
jgi:hypothetical protein